MKISNPPNVIYGDLEVQGDIHISDTDSALFITRSGTKYQALGFMNTDGTAKGSHLAVGEIGLAGNVLMHTDTGNYFGHLANGSWGFSSGAGEIYLGEGAEGPVLDSFLQTPKQIIRFDMGLAVGSADKLSYNVNSLTDHGTGDWSINFNTKLTGITIGLTSANSTLNNVQSMVSGSTMTSVRVECYTDANVLIDEEVSLVVWSDTY